MNLKSPSTFSSCLLYWVLRDLAPVGLPLCICVRQPIKEGGESFSYISNNHGGKNSTAIAETIEITPHSNGSLSIFFPQNISRLHHYTINWMYQGHCSTTSQVAEDHSTLIPKSIFSGNWSLLSEWKMWNRRWHQQQWPHLSITMP